MPHVHLKLYAGKTDEQKQTLAELVTRAVMEGAGCAERSVSVSIEDVAPEDWAESVYRPDIAERPDLLFKKPGYNPL